MPPSPPRRRAFAALLRLLPAVALVALAATPAMACEPRLRVVWEDSAPTDFLRFENQSVGDWRLIAVSIDLAPSAGRLIFDTARGGAGIGSAEPMRHASGAGLAAPLQLRDGDRSVSIAFTGVGPGARSAFSLDLDDTLASGSSPTRVAFSEIAGARLVADFIGPRGAEFSIDGAFGPEGDALLFPAACS